MPDYGLLTTGFVPEPTTVIRDGMNAEIWGKYGTSIDLSDRTPLGYLIGILAERYGKLWETTEQVHGSQDRDKASGSALDAVCVLTGTFREAASPSTVTLTLTGTPTTVVAQGSRAKVSVTNDEFETDIAATIATLTAWAASTAYVVGDRRTNAGRAYVCTVAGTSSGIGPTTTGNYADGSVVWRYMGDGTGAVDVASTCTKTGPTTAVSGDIKTISTAVGGWSGVINLLDATKGKNLASDEELRTAQELDLQRAGTAAKDAIRSALLDVAAVTAVAVFMNNTDVTDADGVPPHAVEALVLGGVDQDIFNKLLASVAAGIFTHGTVIGTALDSQGVSEAVKFSRPTAVPIWVIVDVLTDASTFPADGAAQIKDLIVAYGAAQAAGKNAVASSIGSQAFRVTGVLDTTSVLIGTANPPTASTTIQISSRQIATYDSTRITVNVTNGTP